MRRTVRLLPFFFVFSALAAAESRDILRVPDLPGYKTLKCDFHLHTVFSDGAVWPTARVEEAFRDGLDAIAITDHAGYNPHEKDVAKDLKRPHALASTLAAQAGVLLVPAVEVAEGDTHCNLLFVSEPNVFFGLSMKDALRQAGEQKAFAFYNHPGWKAKPDWIPVIAAAHDENLLHGVEIVNGNDFYPEAYPWIDAKKLTIMADSDAHAPIAAGERRAGGPITLVFAKTRDLAGVREALFARRTAAWMGGEIWAAEEHLRGLWAVAVAAENTSVVVPAGQRYGALLLRNDSAIPFRLRVTQSPDWLSVRAEELKAGTIGALRIAVDRKKAPAGVQKALIECEVANLHVAPGKNLSVQLPVTLELQ